MESALMYQTWKIPDAFVVGRVRKPHRALGAHRNARANQQVRRLKILSALDLSKRRAVKNF